MGPNFGKEPPEWKDLGWIGPDPRRLPLHVKPVTSILLQQLRDLPCRCPLLREFLLRALRWLDDVEEYTKAGVHIFVLPSARLKQGRFFDSDILLMREHEKIEEVTDELSIWGTLLGFWTPEWSKERRRPIFAPDTNAVTEAEPLKYKSRSEVRAELNFGGSDREVYSFDFAAYYDQFILAPEVRKLFCFRHGGSIFRLTRLPMGLRQACLVAQATTWALADVPIEGVCVTTMIDNVRFIGPQHLVRPAVERFLKRCKQVRAVLNGLDLQAMDLDHIDFGELAVHRETFLGEEYDYDRRTVCVGSKSIDKLRWSWSQRTRWTLRRFAAHISLLFYGSSTLGIRLCFFFDILRQFRRLMSDISFGTRHWDQPLGEIPASSFTELETWTNTMLRNEPRSLSFNKKDDDFTHVVITDASRTGWGALSVSIETGSVIFEKDTWNACHDTYARSTDAEPEGVFRAINRFIPPKAKFNVLVVTDHQPLVYAAGAGYAKGFSANLLLRRLAAFRSRFTFVHIKGADNWIADGFSRQQLDGSTGEKLKEEARGMAHEFAEKREGKVYFVYAGPERDPNDSEPDTSSSRPPFMC